MSVPFLGQWAVKWGPTTKFEQVSVRLWGRRGGGEAGAWVFPNSYVWIGPEREGDCTVRSNASWVMATWGLPLWTHWQTHVTEIITFPWRAVKIIATLKLIFSKLYLEKRVIRPAGIALFNLPQMNAETGSWLFLLRSKNKLVPGKLFPEGTLVHFFIYMHPPFSKNELCMEF